MLFVPIYNNSLPSSLFVSAAIFLHNLWTGDAKIFSKSRLVFTTSDVFMNRGHVVNMVNTSSRDQTNTAQRAGQVLGVWSDLVLSRRVTTNDGARMFLRVRLLTHNCMWRQSASDKTYNNDIICKHTTTIFVTDAKVCTVWLVHCN